MVEFAKNATMEQVIVIAKSLLDVADFGVAAKMAQEIFELSYTPWLESDVWNSYSAKFTSAELDQVMLAHSQITIEDVEQAV